jgi:OmpA-OmpF porin, OOP family
VKNIGNSKLITQNLSLKNFRFSLFLTNKSIFNQFTSMRRYLIPLLILALIGWICGCWWYYYCHICGCCGTKAAIGAAPTSNQRPLTFNWTDANSITSANFPAYRDSVVATSMAGDSLVITGRYYEGEVAPTGFANMGLARAAKIKELFANKFPTDRIKLAAERMGASASIKAGCAPFESAAFSLIKPKLDDKGATVLESENSALIYFPFNSAKKDLDPKIDAFLKRFATQHKTDNKAITVTGHTDNVGEEIPNMKLGQRRADQIKGILVKNGIAATRISALSQGEAQPAVPNDTEDNRHRNRRTEILVTQ